MSPNNDTSQMARSEISRAGNRSALVIEIAAAVGEGRTLLSAFDAALCGCGAHNYNLIPLSSVIPPHARVVAVDRLTPVALNGDHGKKLYVVRAEQRSARLGNTIGAGIGWLQWGDGRGLFVEHEAESDTLTEAEMEEMIGDLIRASLQDLVTHRSLQIASMKMQTRIVTGRVSERPMSALVLAIYEAEGWHGGANEESRS